HTCQPGSLDSSHCASGTKKALPADVPGANTSTFLAFAGPTLMTPTLLYFAGVPGALAPFIHVTFSAAAVAGTDSNAAAQTSVVAVRVRVLLERICSSLYSTAAVRLA